MNWKRWIYGHPWMRWYRLRRGKQLAATKRATPDNFLLAAYDMMYRPTWEPAERAAIKGLLTTADAFVDVGANVGYYSVMAAEMGKQVIAIEPDEVNLIVLHANLGDRGTIIPAALSSHSGTAPLFGDGDTASLSREWSAVSRMFRRTVPLTTLDEVLRDRWQDKHIVIKIDVEGAENLVMAGARETLARPVSWIIESFPIHQNGYPDEPPAALAEIMAGYHWTNLGHANFLFTRPAESTVTH